MMTGHEVLPRRAEPKVIIGASQKTYNSGDSLVVTDPTTNPPLTGLSMGERTGSRVLRWVWSYVTRYPPQSAYEPSVGLKPM
ncbi:hypothetical protein CEP54_009300 [Fusarium duplospermum]|uniref:Uncharacterized protein n=1 Tax=Fusarium duplospermum TaxID=1325734 RepID=A0A428PR90_9HYPO|nr:hypothetical protein CEP54_009300 [Fusarium duplospermum]